MNLQQMLLIKLMEECAEVSQACAKALRFGLYEKCGEASITNEEYIQNEVLDVIACLDYLREKDIVSLPIIGGYDEQISPRIDRINKY